MQPSKQGQQMQEKQSKSIGWNAALKKEKGPYQVGEKIIWREKDKILQYTIKEKLSIPANGNVVLRAAESEAAGTAEEDVIRIYPAENATNVSNEIASLKASRHGLFKGHIVQDNGTHVVIMKNIKGQNTYEILQAKAFQQQPLTAHDVYAIPIAMAEELLRLHNAGIAHRDVKLDNFLLKKENNGYIAVLVDHEIACREKDAKANYAIGKVAYAAPETNPLLKTKICNQASDRYSFGVLLAHWYGLINCVGEVTCIDFKTFPFDPQKIVAKWTLNKGSENEVKLISIEQAKHITKIIVELLTAVPEKRTMLDVVRDDLIACKQKEAFSLIKQIKLVFKFNHLSSSFFKTIRAHLSNSSKAPSDDMQPETKTKPTYGK